MGRRVYGKQVSIRKKMEPSNRQLIRGRIELEKKNIIEENAHNFNNYEQNLEVTISIIIPIYNGLNYLEKCLESILHQTLKGIEIIIVDDGSTDGTLEYLQDLENNNILILKQEHLGAGEARNKGMAIARGKYIGFMDSDDYYYNKDVLKKLYDCARENNAMICGGSLVKISEKYIMPRLSKEENEMFFEKDGFIKYSDYQYPYGFTRFIYKRDFIKKNHIQFPSYAIFEDPVFFIHAMIKADKFYAIEDIVYCYRIFEKRYRYSLEFTHGLIRGIIEVLNCANEAKMNNLYQRGLDVLNRLGYPLLARAVTENDGESLRLLIEVSKLKTPFEMSENAIKKFVEECKHDEVEFLSQLQDANNVYVYGAGAVARNVLEFIGSRGVVTIKNVIVSEKEMNPVTVAGIKVIGVEELKNLNEECLIIIAVGGSLVEEVQAIILNYMTCNLIIIDTMKINNWRIVNG